MVGTLCPHLLGGINRCRRLRQPPSRWDRRIRHCDHLPGLAARYRWSRRPALRLFVLIGESESGEASVEAVRQLQPDLVLMDIHLPGIDGPEASAHPASVSERKTPPIVFLLSTYEAADYAAETPACGA